jgi:putative transposase
VARVIGRRGGPTKIRSDNGSGFVCKTLSGWLTRGGSASIPVAAGSPWQNGFIESFHSKLRDEFLERVEFETVADAVEKARGYRRDYNTIRPHSSLDYKTPKEFAADCERKRSEERHCKITKPS